MEALVGTAVVTRQATGEALPLAVGVELFEADRVRTEVGARLRLRLRDGSVLTCGEATGLTLDQALYAPARDSQSFLLRVRSASFDPSRLLTPQSSYDMHTNTAVISVRGTEWIAEAGRAATAIVALEGEVAVRNVDPAVPGEVTLGPGEGVTVEAGTRRQRPRGDTRAATSHGPLIRALLSGFWRRATRLSPFRVALLATLASPPRLLAGQQVAGGATDRGAAARSALPTAAPSARRTTSFWC